MSALLRFMAWALALALVALPVVAVVNGWVGTERFPLRKLRVTSQFERVDPQLLRSTVLPYARQGFFAVQLDDAQAAVSKLPWVDRAEVRKHWPDVLEIRLVEHAPFARWGKDRLLSQQGRLLPVKGIDVPKGLPLLDGPDTRTADVVALYNEAREMFAASGVQVRGIALDPRGSWSLTLDNAAQVVVGRGDEDARLRLSRFARLLPQLLEQQQRPLLRADLRYTNGFALTWGEASGIGNRASGIGQPQSLPLARAPLPPARVAFALAFSILDSRFPIPGTPS
ncbi:cell division protein FtsQ [Luteimonas cucumeris]|uniref:Cell division protein FtsQ n=1 Tax=Luteimonas cucumeris TaxID=985012 RepID=A0A562L5K4_9GAMM|nr:cell division protein FtsQ/DivIB [Luteimonas cucumeris]TWI02903.1 cell division protein FtsQ [Luteimonas cucumeris]